MVCGWLQPASLDSIDPNIKGTPLVLLNTHPPQDIRDPCLRSPVEIIMDNVLRDLLSAFEIVSNEMQVQSSDLVKPTLVARFGKILFQGDPSAAQAAVLKNLAALSLLRRSFYTNIPTSYMEKITGEVLPSTEEEKELFHIKTELHQVRHMVTDISCLVKNLDLRLMLCNRRILTSLTDYEMQHIQDLIQSAVLDPNVKGGLRWHLGKSASGGRFTVIGVWHTITKSYRTSSLRLKVRSADRFDFRTSTGESASEVMLKLKGILSEIQVEKVDISRISKILEETLKLIWDHFLNSEPFLG